MRIARTMRWKRKAALVVAAALTAGSMGLVYAGTSGAAGTVGAGVDAVCPDLDTGHLSAGNQTSVTITAPEGQVIVQVCVKAGSAQQGDGPEFTDFDPGVTETTISHSSGKEISHYSVKFADAPPPPPNGPPPNGPPPNGPPPLGPGPAAAPAPAPPRAPSAAPAPPRAPSAAAPVQGVPRVTG
jgi:hypothetical protein